MSKSKFAKVNRGAFNAGILTSIAVICTSLTKIFDRIVSPWDELYHLAYVQYLYNFVLPQRGDEILSWSKYAFSCFPVHPYGMTTAVPCGAEAPAQAFPEMGRNVAAVWPPIYYALSSIWMRIFGVNPENALFIGRSFSSLVWGLGAGLFCYALITRNQLKSQAAVPLSLVIALLPLGLFQGLFVTPHSMSLLLASLLYLSATSPAPVNEKRLISFILMSTIAILVIPHILPIIVFFTAQIILKNWSVIRDKSSILLLYILSISIIPVIATITWQRFQDSRRLDIETAVQPSSQFTFDQIPRALFTFIPHSIDGYQFINVWQHLISYVLSILLLVLILKPLVETSSSILKKSESLILVGISGTFGILEHIAFGIIIPPRYGLSLIFVAFLVATQGGVSIFVERTFKFLALIALVLALSGPVFTSLV
jgi:hypothetical protein